MSIHAYMRRREKATWASRLLGKNEIELEITTLKADLEDAVRSFQVGLSG